MSKKEVLMIAPGHDLNDIRIKRSLNSLSLSFQSITIVLDKKYKKFNKDGEINGFNDVTIIYDDIYKFLFNNKLNELIDNSCEKSFNLIYVHDSGLLGSLLLRFSLRNSTIEKLLDYHDWIAWEIYYQITKRIGVNKIGMLFYSLLYKLVSKLISSMKVNYLIGISSLQLESLTSRINYTVDSKNSIVIPNTREKLSLNRTVSDDEYGLLWIGNFMRGRDIAKILNYMSQLPEGKRPRLYICGNIYDSDYFEEVVETGWIDYLGGFKNDQDLMNKIPSKKLIGVFLGWDDKFNTNINEIASPNKVYSYINLNLPIIYNSRLTNIRNITNDKGCISIDSNEAFETALVEITENYDQYHSNIIETKNSIQWNKEIQSAFNKYVTANFTS